MILAIAAIVITVLALIVNAWAVNQSRMLNQWCRSRFAGPMPTWRQLRWRPTTQPLYGPVVHVEGTLTQKAMDDEFRKWLRKHVRPRPPGGMASA